MVEFLPHYLRLCISIFLGCCRLRATCLHNQARKRYVLDMRPRLHLKADFSIPRYGRQRPLALQQSFLDEWVLSTRYPIAGLLELIGGHSIWPFVNRAGGPERLEKVLVHLPLLEALLEEFLPRKLREVPAVLGL
jgi:hypothetical protein